MQDYDDIDLRPYILAIAQRWYWVVACTLLFAALAAGVSLALPKRYTATASVLLFIRQTGSQVGVNQPIVSIETIDIASRRQGLLALAQSDAIEAQIQPDVLQQIASTGYRPGMLTRQIRVRSEGDLLKISANGASPEQAQRRADTWATTYVNYVTTLYTDEHSQVQMAGAALRPLAPSTPRLVLNILIGGILGVLIGTGLALVRASARKPVVAARHPVDREGAARSAIS